VLVANGAILGTIFAVLELRGVSWALLTFVAAHGVLELSAIVLSGAAGLRFAWAILQPGERSRRAALRLAGIQVVRIVLLVAVVLGFAGLIEAFVSPTTLLPAVKAGVGIVTGTLLWGYVALAGRRLRPEAQRKRFFSSR
jgi:uncharacterized membrane protein SpoIIM required for sporulation